MLKVCLSAASAATIPADPGWAVGVMTGEEPARLNERAGRTVGRGVSLGAQAIMWTVLGLGFGAWVERDLAPVKQGRLQPI